MEFFCESLIGDPQKNSIIQDNIDRTITKVVNSWSEGRRKALVSWFNSTGPLVLFAVAPCRRSVDVRSGRLASLLHPVALFLLRAPAIVLLGVQYREIAFVGLRQDRSRELGVDVVSIVIGMAGLSSFSSGWLRALIFDSLRQARSHDRRCRVFWRQFRVSKCGPDLKNSTTLLPSPRVYQISV
jgi:hypothetical protein